MIVLSPKLPIETSRLVLREFIKDDIATITDIINHTRFAGYSQFRLNNISADVELYITEAIDFQKLEDRDIYRLGIYSTEHRKIIGACVFDGWHRKDENDQIGYFLHPDFQRKGYAFEAVSFLLRSYFSCYPQKAAHAKVHPSNKSSQKLLEKLGFVHYGMSDIDIYGIKEPRLLYRIDASKLTDD